MITIETLLETLKTGSGFWNPIVWIVAIVVAFLSLDSHFMTSLRSRLWI